jgi:hypothetical protein
MYEDKVIFCDDITNYLTNFKDVIEEKYNIDKPIFDKYPELFHKYKLGLRNPDYDIKNNYKLIKESSLERKYICAIQCFDLNKFEEYFGEYLDKINKYFDILVTYFIDNQNIIDKYEYTFIYTKNYGMDIGGKFVAVDYLNSNNNKYDYIFFIHSKNNKISRNKYISSFIENIDEIAKDMITTNIGGFFNDLWYDGVTPIKNKQYNYTDWNYNKIYMNQIISIPI